MADAKIVIPFTVTSAQVLTLDTTSVTLYTFDANTRVVRVPQRLEITKPAGTAYTLTRGFTNNTENVSTTARIPLDRRGIHDLSYRYTAEGGNAWLVVRDTLGAPAFWIPADRLLQTTAESGLVVLPLNSGRFYTTLQTSFVLRSTVPIATGTSVLNGRIYFEEYSIA